MIKKVKSAVLWAYVVSTLKRIKLAEAFYEKEFTTNQKEFRVQKVVKRNSDKLYVKQKGCDNFCNSWIYKKDIV